MRYELIFYRIGNYFYRHKMIFFSKLCSGINRLIFSSWVPSSATIGENVSLGYWGLGIVIHSNSIIGNNCLIAQNVTIGRNLGDKRVPIIGNDVYIGAGTVLFGEIEIGNNVIIGSNSLVNKSVPANSTVVGNPMRIIKTNRKDKYWEFDIDKVQ